MDLYPLHRRSQTQAPSADARPAMEAEWAHARVKHAQTCAELAELRATHLKHRQDAADVQHALAEKATKYKDRYTEVVAHAKDALSRQETEIDRLQTRLKAGRAEYQRLAGDRASLLGDLKEVARVRDELGRLRAGHAKVLEAHESVQDRHSRLQAEHAKTRAEHAKTLAAHERLEATHAKTLAAHAKTQTAHAKAREMLSKVEAVLRACHEFHAKTRSPLATALQESHQNLVQFMREPA